MTSDYNKNLWNAVLAELEEKISNRLHSLWFQNTELISYSKDLLTISVENEFIQQRILENHKQDIVDAVFKCCGDQPELDLVIREENKEEQGFFDFEEKANTYWQQEGAKEFPAVHANIEAVKQRIQLNDLYIFENFVVGPSNQLAHAAALAVANKPGETYNPLFMYGAVGLGKTHLLQAICHNILSTSEKHNIVYLSCEEFINQFITSVENGNVEGFRQTFRYIDILVIDDIHFLANKERTQEEFFHVFNMFYNAHKQIILSSDSPPSEIPELRERLVSRFKWGLVSQVDVPTFETRVAIVKKKSRIKGTPFSDSVCQYISENIVSNIRELEGAINHLLALSDLHKQNITLEFAQQHLKEVIIPEETMIQLPLIMNIVAKEFNVTIADLQSKKRHKSIVVPRQTGMYLAKKLTNYSLLEIANFFGKRDHTTVLHAVDKIKDLRKQDKELHEKLVDIEYKISGTDSSE